MPALRDMPLQIAIAFDQLCNALTGGWADETLSSRAWRLRAHPGWNAFRLVVEALFFWQENHCKASYESEIMRNHLPGEQR